VVCHNAMQIRKKSGHTFTKKYLPLYISGFILLMVFSFYLKINNNSSVSPEIQLASVSPNGESKGSVIAASCGFGNDQPHFDGDTACGGTVVTTCTNGATNPPSCNICPGNTAMLDGQCLTCNYLGCGDNICLNGATNPPSCDICPTGQFLSGMTNRCELVIDTICNVCPEGKAMMNNQCMTCNYSGCRNVNCRAVCSNGATNPPLCNICPTGQFLSGMTNRCELVIDTICNVCPEGKAMMNNQCMTCNYSGCRNVNCRAVCSNGATNPPLCNICPTGQFLSGMTNRCEPIVNCPNGATNPPSCNTCQTPQYYWKGGSCQPNPCGNVIPPNNYGQICSGAKNSCGQQSSGTIQCNGTCNAPAITNSSCIQTYKLSTNSIYPNGSVDFSWRVLPATDGGSVKCGFYDRSKSNGVGLGTPIPGLQNLDIASDKFRINNIQRNTEFCLVCVYTDRNANPQTPAAQHQWVRVIRIGEQ
jgi:hypothetical protein